MLLCNRSLYLPGRLKARTVDLDEIDLVANVMVSSDLDASDLVSKVLDAIDLVSSDLDARELHARDFDASERDEIEN